SLRNSRPPFSFSFWPSHLPRISSRGLAAAGRGRSGPGPLAVGGASGPVGGAGSVEDVPVANRTRRPPSRTTPPRARAPGWRGRRGRVRGVGRQAVIRRLGGGPARGGRPDPGRGQACPPPFRGFGGAAGNRGWGWRGAADGQRWRGGRPPGGLGGRLSDELGR